jgi:hypothetical protein
MFFVQRDDFNIQQICQSLNARFAAGRTLVNGFSIGDGLRVGATAWISTLATLSLRQNIVDFVCNGVAFGLELFCGKSKQRAKHSGQAYQSEQRSKQRIL